MKRSLLSIYVMLVVSIVLAQRLPMGGGFSQNPIKAEDLAEVLILEPEKVTKKIKLKGPEEKLCWKLTTDYNQAIDSIRLSNFETLDAINKDLIRVQANAMRSRDPRMMQVQMVEISRKLEPILNATREVRKLFTSRVKLIVDVKQFDKFEKYVERRLEELKPRTPQSRMPTGASRRSGF